MRQVTSLACAVRTLQAGAMALCLLAFSAPAFAEDFSSTDIQLLYTSRSKADAGNGTGTSDEKLTTIRAEHFGTWKYGDNYLDLDMFQGKAVGGATAGSFGNDARRQYFFIWVPRISLGKTFGWKLDGFVKDVHVAYRAERASYADFRADNYGISFDLAVPGTVFFEQDFFARKTNFDQGTKMLSRTVWLAPFKVGSIGAHYDGLVLIKTTQNSGTDLFTQQDLLVDIGAEGKVQVGMRFEYHKSRGYSRTTPTAMVKWTF